MRKNYYRYGLIMYKSNTVLKLIGACINAKGRIQLE